MPACVACAVSQCKLRLDSCHNGWCIMACHDVLVVRQLWWWCVMHVGSCSAVLGCNSRRWPSAFAKTSAFSCTRPRSVLQDCAHTGCNGDLTMLRHCWFCSWLQSGATCPMWVAVSGRRQVGVPDGVGAVLAGVGRQLGRRLLGWLPSADREKRNEWWIDGYTSRFA